MIEDGEVDSHEVSGALKHLGGDVPCPGATLAGLDEIGHLGSTDTVHAEAECRGEVLGVPLAGFRADLGGHGFLGNLHPAFANFLPQYFGNALRADACPLSFASTFEVNRHERARNSRAGDRATGSKVLDEKEAAGRGVEDTSGLAVGDVDELGRFDTGDKSEFAGISLKIGIELDAKAQGLTRCDR